jgi:type IV pilus assembly protein PilZ
MVRAKKKSSSKKKKTIKKKTAVSNKKKTNKKSTKTKKKTAKKKVVKRKTTKKKRTPPKAKTDLFSELLSKIETSMKKNTIVGFEKLKKKDKKIIHTLIKYLVRNAFRVQRRHSRIDTRLDVIVKYGQETLRAETRDLSLGGMFVVTDSEVTPGDLVDFELILPQGMPPVVGQAKVVHSFHSSTPNRYPGCGLQFVSFDLGVVRNYLGKLIKGEISPFRDERRRHGRVKHPFQARLLSEESSSVVTVRDIGSGGVFLETDSPLEPGTDVEIVLISPLTLQQMSLTGTVVRQELSDPNRPQTKPGMGVAFTKLDPKPMENLLTFLNDFIDLDNG